MPTPLLTNRRLQSSRRRKLRSLASTSGPGACWRVKSGLDSAREQVRAFACLLPAVTGRVSATEDWR